VIFQLLGGECFLSNIKFIFFKFDKVIYNQGAGGTTLKKPVCYVQFSTSLADSSIQNENSKEGDVTTTTSDEIDNNIPSQPPSNDNEDDFVDVPNSPIRSEAVKSPKKVLQAQQ